LIDMPDAGFIPWPVFGLMATATVFAVMFAIGVAMDVRDLRWALSQPALVARSLLSVMVIVPVVAILIARWLDISREAEIGIALMAISPGAPVALRRSLDAGGHHSFAAVLQLLMASAAIVTMPLSVAILNVVHGTHGEVAVAIVAKQVLVAQLVPLCLGLAIHRVWPAFAARIESTVRRLAAVMLASFAVVVLAAIWRLVFAAGFMLTLGVVVMTALALGIGRLLGGPARETRTAVAISSALRNPGLALLVATGNGAPPEVSATIFAYLIWSGVTVTAYLAFRRRRSGTGPIARG
jgi:BASS family bile acid:Na+ symporter